MSHEDRIAKASGKLADLGVEALLVTNLSNVRYLTGFSGSNGQVLLTPTQALFFSDGRYAQRAKLLVQGAEIGIYPQRLTDLLGPALTSRNITRLGIEAATMTLAERDDLASRIADVELITTKETVEALRRIKDAEEIASINKAIAVADAAFEWILERLTPGKLERDVALELEVHMRENGAEDVSFEPIVGSGPLSAHIHHVPSDRAIDKGDLVLMDFGALVDGYCSDMTRTVVLGPATDEQLEMYDLVLRAQQASMDAIRAGVPCRDVDAAARKLITDAGRGEQFGHGLGHGVGLDIHEIPNMSKISEDNLSAGEVVTVEPGVYVPDLGGIRIEDCVRVTEQGCEVLGTAPREKLIEL